MFFKERSSYVVVICVNGGLRQLRSVPPRRDSVEARPESSKEPDGGSFLPPFSLYYDSFIYSSCSLKPALSPVRG